MESQLLEVVQCSICLREMEAPTALPCLHSFCRECLLTHIRINAHGKFNCPTCRVQIPLPRNSLEGFPTDFKINRLKEIIHCDQKLRERAKMSKTKCGVCSSEHNVDKYCVDCEKFYCVICEYKHGTSMILKNHHTVKVTDGLSLPNSKQRVYKKLSRSDSEEMCNIHQSNLLKYHCEDCDMNGCVACILTTHKGHKVRNNVSMETRSLVESHQACSEHIENQMRQLHSVLNSMLDAQHKMEKCLTETKHEIRRHSQLMVRKILEKEEGMIANLEREYWQEMEEFNADQKLCEDALHKFEMLLRRLTEDIHEADVKPRIMKQVQRIEVNKKLEKTYKKFMKFIPIESVAYGMLSRLNRVESVCDQSGCDDDIKNVFVDSLLENRRFTLTPMEDRDSRESREPHGARLKKYSPFHGGS